MVPHCNRLFLSLLLASLTLGCGSAPTDSFGSVHGAVTVDSTPAPQGSRLRFYHINDADAAFIAIIGPDGTYAYKPPAKAPLKQGEYKVVFEPNLSKTEVDESGLAVEVASGAARKGYDRFTNLKKSGLKTTLTKGNVEFNVDVTKESS